MKRILDDTEHNLRSGLGLAFFRRRALSDFRIGLDQAIFLIVIGLALALACDFVLAAPKPRFNAGAIPAFALSLVLFYVSAYLFSLVTRRRESALRFMVLIASALPVFYFVETGLTLLYTHWDDFPDGLYRVLLWGYAGWALWVLVRAIHLAAEGGKRQLTAGLALFIGVAVVPLILGGWNIPFWRGDESGRPDFFAPYRAMDAEALLYEQPELLQHVIQGLAPERAGVNDLYFIGFAGYAYQDVFAKELQYARRVLDDRYETQGRSLLLVNHLESRRETPLATATNLERAIKQVGEIMNKEEDVLMIYMTSHGYASHDLAVDFWPLPLNDVTPERLRAMLDAAGIKWRVVVVSACYSGGFVPALEDEFTAVATAAAPDRTSFGCGSEDDFTYFGEALFKDELSQRYSLLDAFKNVRKVIAERERLEKLEPSLPQLYVAPLMEGKLREYSEGLRQRRCQETVQDVALC